MELGAECQRPSFYMYMDTSGALFLKFSEQWTFMKWGESLKFADLCAECNWSLNIENGGKSGSNQHMLPEKHQICMISSTTIQETDKIADTRLREIQMNFNHTWSCNRLLVYMSSVLQLKWRCEHATLRSIFWFQNWKQNFKCQDEICNNIKRTSSVYSYRDNQRSVVFNHKVVCLCF